jgi:hypothetical protein
MKKSLFIIPFLLLHFIGFAQWRKVEKLERDKTPNIKLAYWTDATFQYPGLIIGGEFMFKRRKVTIKRFKRTKENYLAINFYYFNEPDLQRAAALNIGWLKRTMYQNSGIFTDLTLGASFGRDATTRPTTYVKNPDGSETIKAATKNFIMVPIALGLGYDFMPRMEKPLKVYARLGVAPIYDFGTLLQTEFKIEIGAVAPLSVFKKKS